MACGREQVPLLGKRRATEEDQLLGGYSMRVISIRFLQHLLHTFFYEYCSSTFNTPTKLAALSSSSSVPHMYSVRSFKSVTITQYCFSSYLLLETSCLAFMASLSVIIQGLLCS